MDYGSAQNGLYDGSTFHRVAHLADGQPFVIEGGDTGSSLPDGFIDDEFHPDLQHTTAGLISTANAGDDTNGSQFFVPDAPVQTLGTGESLYGVRWLDSSHSIFGVLTEGEDEPTGDHRGSRYGSVVPRDVAVCDTQSADVLP